MGLPAVNGGAAPRADLNAGVATGRRLEVAGARAVARCLSIPEVEALALRGLGGGLFLASMFSTGPDRGCKDGILGTIGDVGTEGLITAGLSTAAPGVGGPLSMSSLYANLNSSGIFVTGFSSSVAPGLASFHSASRSDMTSSLLLVPHPLHCHFRDSYASLFLDSLFMSKPPT